jgi:hypothetical protein
MLVPIFFGRVVDDSIAPNAINLSFKSDTIPA